MNKFLIIITIFILTLIFSLLVMFGYGLLVGYFTFVSATGPILFIFASAFLAIALALIKTINAAWVISHGHYTKIYSPSSFHPEELKGMIVEFIDKDALQSGLVFDRSIYNRHTVQMFVPKQPVDYNRIYFRSEADLAQFILMSS